MAQPKQAELPLKKKDENVEAKSCKWKGTTELAKALAEKHSNGKGVNNIQYILSGHRAVASGRWRECLENLGVKFNKDNKVIDWRVIEEI